MANITRAFRRWKDVLLITFLVRAFLFTLSTLTLHTPNIDIAKNWYQFSGPQALWIVFSPMYPILIRIFNFLINDFSISTIAISIIFSFIASILLFELTLLDFERKVAIFSGIYIFFRVRKSYGVYTLTNFLFFSSSGYIMSTPRHMLVLFPIFIPLGKIKNKIIIISVSLFSIMLLIYYTSFYIRGQWAF